MRLLPQSHPHGRAHDYRMLGRWFADLRAAAQDATRNAAAGLLDAATLGA
ncbi:MAG: hypothetical protein IPG64_06125 [Haliea sp.]|nr:hypothetical protein [Haliea sp.]